MLRDDILIRYILSSSQFQTCVPSHDPAYACKLSAYAYIAATPESAFSCPPRPRPRERSSNGCATYAPPDRGGGPGFVPRAESSGNSGYAGHHRCVRESARGWTDPELSRRVLPDDSRLSAMVPGAARSLTGDGERVFPGQHPGGAPSRCDVAGHEIGRASCREGVTRL